MPGSRPLWLNTFNQLAFSRNANREIPALSPAPFPKRGGTYGSMPAGKGFGTAKIGPAVKERPPGQFCAGSLKISELLSESRDQTEIQTKNSDKQDPSDQYDKEILTNPGVTHVPVHLFTIFVCYTPRGGKGHKFE
jgi:hypothetical protein